MGRQAAGEGLLRVATYAEATLLSCHTDHPGAARHFEVQLIQTGYHGQTSWVPIDQPTGLAQSGCLYLPEPNLSDSAWRRAAYGERTYSLRRVTHTTASHIAITAIIDLLIVPILSWDALICASMAVRDTVHILLENQANYLRTFSSG